MLAGLAAVFLLLCAFYYRQFHKVLRIRTSVDRLFRPNYQLSFGYFLAKRAPEMQNQATGWNNDLTPGVERELLLGQGWTLRDWTHSLNISPESPVYRFNVKAGLEGLKASRIVSTESLGSAPKVETSTVPFSFFEKRATQNEAGVAANLRSAAELLEFSIDLMKRAYPITDGDLMTVRANVAYNIPYYSTWVYTPPLRFDLKSTAAAPAKRLKQEAAFLVRVFRNYYLNGNYHEVYLQVEPSGGDFSEKRLRAEVDRAAFDSISPEAQSRINCIDVSEQGEGAQAKRFVRAARCRAKVDIQLANGKIRRIGGVFTEEPLSVLTWMCSGAKTTLNCRPVESSTAIQALELTRE